MTRNWYNDTKTCHVMALIQFGFDKIYWYNDSKLKQWLKIDTMTQNWYNDSKLIQWLKIDTMTQNWYYVMGLIQCFEFNIISCSFADIISKAKSFLFVEEYVCTCERTSEQVNSRINKISSVIIEECVHSQRILWIFLPMGTMGLYGNSRCSLYVFI